MVDMTLIRPLNKGQGHSFGYQLISHNAAYAVNSNFCSRTLRLATIHNVTDRQTDDTAQKARPLVRSAKKRKTIIGMT